MSPLLQDWVTIQADQQPEKRAIVGQDGELTYQDLEMTSNQLSRQLHDSGCRKGDRVCLLLPKSTRAILAMLGALKSGAMYVPLDPDGAPARLAKKVEKSNAAFILAAPELEEMLNRILASESLQHEVRVGWMGSRQELSDETPVDFSREDWSTYPTGHANLNQDEDTPAHILFTSGSTGAPKGVMVTHANVNHFIGWANEYFQVTSDDRNSGHPPLHFDLSTYDIYGTFAAGAELHLVPSHLNVRADKLIQFMRERRLTRWFSAPSILTYLAKFDVVKHSDFPDLKHLIWCGEVFPTPSLRYWMERLPHVQFTNLYGPTETTIASTYYTIPECPDDDRTEIPIGMACDGEEALVLDEQMRPVTDGEKGHLYIRGAGVTKGYWKDPKKTEAVFKPDIASDEQNGWIYDTGDLASRDEHGLLHFHGRKDYQIKSRGHRIELGEVERAVQSLRDVAECGVVAISSNGFEGKQICCAYSGLPEKTAVDPASLRGELQSVLPGYMIPVQWKSMGNLPKNRSGKIDRVKLQTLFENHGS